MVVGVEVVTGVLSDGNGAEAFVEALAGATTAICEGASLRIKLWLLRPWGFVTVERSWPEFDRFWVVACSVDDGAVLCAKADDVPYSEIGSRQVANDRQVPEIANTKSLLCCVTDDLIGRMVDILRVARPAIHVAEL